MQVFEVVHDLKHSLLKHGSMGLKNLFGLKIESTVRDVKTRTLGGSER